MEVTESTQDRLRLRVGSVEESVFDLGPEDVSNVEGPGPDVRPRRQTAEDRAAGARRYETTIDGWVIEISAESEALARLRERAGQGRGASTHHGSDAIVAQIPGRVVRLWVTEGDTVEAGQRLLAIEAMKMENEVRAPRAGTVEAVRVAADSSVELGDELLTVR